MTLRTLLVAVVVITAAIIGTRWLIDRAIYGGDGYFEGDDYAELRGYFNPGLVSHMPKTLPKSATNISIYAPGSDSRMPLPDRMMEVRFTLPPSEAAAIEDHAAQNQIEVEFLWVGGKNEAGFNSYILVNPIGGHVGGVSVNRATGEVEYWCYES